MSSRPTGDARVSYGLRAPSPRTGKIPVLQITSSSWRDFVILTSRVYGVEVYFDGQRSQPITDGQRADPEVYQSLLSKRWQGWIAVRPYQLPTVYLVAVTPVTVICVPQLDDESFDLRGWCFALARESGDKRAKLKGRWNNKQADLLKLPHPPDVIAALENMWNAPLKRKVTSSPSASDDGARQARRVLNEVASSLVIPL